MTPCGQSFCPQSNLAETLLVSDRHPAYRDMKRDLPHEMVNHELEYVRKDMPEIHTQNI